MTFAEWAQQIRASSATTFKTFLMRGDLLIAAKKELGHGNKRGHDGFQQLFEGDPKPAGMSQRTAQRLMAIAAHPILSNATYSSLFPDSWPMCYDLACLPLGELQKAIDEGKVRREMSREEVLRLRPVAQAVEEDILQPLRDEGVDCEGVDRPKVEGIYNEFVVHRRPHPKIAPQERDQEERREVEGILRRAVKEAERRCRRARRAVVAGVLVEIVKERRRVAARRQHEGRRTLRKSAPQLLGATRAVPAP